ncbi:MAG: lytic transglycosylase domain-containing protein [Deltaproteobacteria bacterium]|nr:lytic transglycosylase domain-containing protein [Deltaproteobacteria bacterium]
MIAAVAVVLIVLADERASCMERFAVRAPESARHYFTKFDAVFATVGRRRGVEPSLLKAVAYCESRFDPCAESGAQARGLMQFIGTTFAMVSGDGTSPFDPIDAIEAAGVYVAALMNYWRGDLEAVVASYNAGPGAVAKARRAGRRLPAIEETERYVECVLGAKARLESAGAQANPRSIFGRLVQAITTQRGTP